MSVSIISFRIRSRHAYVSFTFRHSVSQRIIRVLVLFYGGFQVYIFKNENVNEIFSSD